MKYIQFFYIYFTVIIIHIFRNILVFRFLLCTYYNFIVHFFVPFSVLALLLCKKNMPLIIPRIYIHFILYNCWILFSKMCCSGIKCKISTKILVWNKDFFEIGELVIFEPFWTINCNKENCKRKIEDLVGDFGIKSWVISPMK